MILVTGGTGLVGAHLMYFLLNENRNVRAIYRKGSDLNGVKKVFSTYTSNSDSLFDKIDWVEADILDIPALTEAFINVSQVFHCAAYINFNPAKYRKLKKNNMEGTANVVNLCLATGVIKLCYVSSVATFGKTLKNSSINEENGWNPDEKNSVYSITKYLAEMEVWRGTQEGLDAVIVNPGIIFGTSPNNRGSGIISKLVSRSINYYPPGTMGIVDVQDVVKAMILLMDSNIINQQYILVGENVSYKYILDQMAELNDKKYTSKKLSKGFMYFLSGLDWLSSKLFGTKRRLVNSTVRSMFSTSIYDSSKIKKQLNFEFTPTKKTLQNLIANERKLN